MFPAVVFFPSARTQDSGSPPPPPHVPCAVTGGTVADETCTLASGNQPRQRLQAEGLCTDCPAGHSLPRWQVPNFPSLAFEALRVFDSATKFYEIYGKTVSVRPLPPVKFDQGWLAD